MRGATIAGLVIISIWLGLTLRMSCTEVNTSICVSLCNSKGRELRSMEAGFINKCYCGERKKAPKSLRRN